MSKNVENCIIGVKMGLVECARASGDMVGTFVSNSDPWGCLGARVMTIFVSDPHIPNIGYMRVYEGLQALGGISSFSS